MLKGKALSLEYLGNRLPAWVKIGVNKVIKIGDHTYVECSNSGKAWGCHGRNSGGRELVSGNGSHVEADCVYGNDKAGIRYLMTGVCHQTANRTLSSTDKTVFGARGYLATVATYGEYGLYQAEWLARQKLCAVSGAYTMEHRYMYRALIAKRIALKKSQISDSELNTIFPNVDQGFRSKLKKLTTDWKLKFLEHAISQYKYQNYHQFYNHVHIGLNKYLQDCAGVIGYDDMAERLGFEGFDENTMVLMAAPEPQVDIEEQS
ncbi:hypothetical protein [Photobacterium carnosum]|jgi:hypothetical protein|uniref:hypothetical protein n=1 Tax=Photobacterium carnosum TaxID=2023717 RepID=UPI001E5692C0|nr:hypothetical protein [Photobacterium carnosum]MCD9530069.1 hypothetical protein [Photobacterium carnosum]MCF2152927.1 hypothetical protein [Photobacterium carnosum]MCF2214687.1 hypothetical protein [Photobacterium carnosum]